MNEFEGAIHTCNSNSFMKGYEELKSYWRLNGGLQKNCRIGDSMVVCKKIEMWDKKEAMDQI